jgi:hypothetical protein
MPNTKTRCGSLPGRSGALQLVDELLVEVGAVVAAWAQRQGAGHQLAPELRLPILTAHSGQLLAQSFPLFPAGDPVRPVDQILVEQIRHLLAELPEPHLLRHRPVIPPR